MKKPRRRSLMLAGSCPHPTYGRVLLSDAAFGVIPVVAAAVGMAAGAAVAGGDIANKATGALIGGTLGYTAGFVPGFFIQRKVLRSPGCKDPSTSKILTYDVAKSGLAVGARYLGRKLGGDAGGGLAALATIFVSPLIGMPLLRE
jgi:hypothetical protein